MSEPGTDADDAGRPREQRVDTGAEIEEALPAGDVTLGVVRVGNTVRRPHQSTSTAVAAYLGFLERAGFAAAPRYLGTDAQGRDVLTFIEGDVARTPVEPWARDDALLPSVAKLLRRLHDVSAAWIPDIAIGAHPEGRPAPVFPVDEPRLVSHRDVTPQNVVCREGRAYALIDFDLVGWTTRSVDLANTAMHWVPLTAPEDLPAGYSAADTGRRLRLMLDAYGRDAVSAELLLHAADLRFGAGYESMKWAAENLGGGWTRMWEEGVGDVIRRRVAWFASARDELAVALA
jgi:aminoglycoside phosphotransferase (APT) family kinase protein